MELQLIFFLFFFLFRFEKRCSLIKKRETDTASANSNPTDILSEEDIRGINIDLVVGVKLDDLSLRQILHLSSGKLKPILDGSGSSFRLI